MRDLGVGSDSVSSDIYRDLVVVIPTLNEAQAIGYVLDEVLAIGVPRENVIVVDGGSTDGTVEIAESRSIKVVPQEGRGKADAIRTALKYIDSDKRYVLIMDGDYTYPAQYIPNLVKEINKGFDMVIAVRIPEPGAQGFLYRLGNRILTTVFNILFGTRLRDVLSGMYVVRRDFLEEVMFSSKGFGIESEIVAHVVSMGGTVAEIPIVYRKRIGVKKLRIRHGLNILKTIAILAWGYNPLFTFFAIASLLLIPGLALGAWVAYRLLFHGVLHHIRGLAAIVLTGTGFNAFLLALLSLYLKRQELRITKMLRQILYINRSHQEA